MYRLIPTTFGRIQKLAARAEARDSGIVVRAGTPLVQHTPNGFGEIIKKGGTGGLGGSAGLTLIKDAGGFKAPSFQTKTSFEREGNDVRHFAEVLPTTSSDATHESFFPAPGDHLRPGMTQQISGRTYNHYWRVSAQMSRLIRSGEEEHLADAQRAYNLTYKLIADTINSMKGQRFGPARTPSDAERLAEDEFGRRLPSALGTDPRTWPEVLNRLLLLTKERDKRGWHSISTDPPFRDGNKIVHVVARTSNTSVGLTNSASVVNY